MSPAFQQWDIVRVRLNPDDRDEHPAVILTPDELCADPAKQQINVLYGSTRRPATAPRPSQFTLNGADGLDHSTLISCSHIYSVDRRKISTVLGRVALSRRRPLTRTLLAVYRLPL